MYKYQTWKTLLITTFKLPAQFTFDDDNKPTVKFGSSTDQRRAADTCADPNLTSVFVEANSPSRIAHIIRARWVFIVTDSANGGDWQIQSDAFLAWETPENFTIPLYQLTNPSGTDFIFVTSPNGNPPTVSGFQSCGIIGYVNSTQVCGSVPLLVAQQASTSDHWYTTSAFEHGQFLANGWTDAGVAAFVLPLMSDCTCSP